VFLTTEHAKDRFRCVQHPERANKLTSGDAGVNFVPFHDRHNAVLKGRYSIDVDWSAFFDQFRLSDEVSKYFCFKVVDGTVYSMNVLPMGFKHSVSIAHTATLQLLNFNPSCYVEAYIDNVRLVGDDKEALIRDAATLLTRCAQARVTVNEADATLLRDLPEEERMAAAIKLVTPLCTQKAPWLGELYDYEHKTIELAEKTREKVARCMDAPRRSYRSFAGMAGILQYASRTLGLPLARFYPARRAISDIAWLLQGCDELWDKPMPPLCDAVQKNFALWRDMVLQAAPRVMKEPMAPELVIIVDASDTGWGALSFDEHGREAFQRQQWTKADERCFDPKVSTRAEPEGLYRACCAFVRPNVHRTVYIASDSSATVGAINKGQSLSYWMNKVCDRLQAAFPGVDFKVVHTPGLGNPADGISRELLEPTSEDWSIGRKLADQAKATRFSGRLNAKATRGVGSAA